jgi:uncharacterized protein
MTHAVLTRWLWTLAVLLILTAGVAAALPDPQGYVTDLVGALDTTTRDQLTATLTALESDTTAEVAVAVVPSLDGMSIEEYATRLFSQWGVGKKGIDNGVLVLVAPNDRRVRIEVGYGLEPILPDGLAGEIIRQQFLPKFRQEDYSGGIRDGVARVAAILRARHIVTGEERRKLDAAEHKNDWLMEPFLAMFVAIGAMAIGLGARTRTISPILFGLLFGGFPFLVGWMFGPAWTDYVLGSLAAALTVLGFTLGKRDSWRSIVRSGRSAYAPGWVIGGGRSSGSSSSSSSSGSFGGGSSGGGGASGSW